MEQQSPKEEQSKEATARPLEMNRRYKTQVFMLMGFAVAGMVISEFTGLSLIEILMLALIIGIPLLVIYLRFGGSLAVVKNNQKK